MIWKKMYGINHAKNVDFIIIVMLVLSLLGAIARSPLFFLLTGIFATHLFISKYYVKKIEKQLILENPKVKIKLFPGEVSTVAFHFQNQSLFPLLNGELQFRTGPAIKTIEQHNYHKNYWKVIKIFASLYSHRKMSIDIPIMAEQRGTTRLHEIMYSFPHLFMFDTVSLLYSKNFQTEIIVFPKPLPVHGMETVFYQNSGEQRVKFSPIEDIQSPLGTRDYQFSDPFHRINWKASAKTQKLQTNVYEKTADMSFVFIVNLTVENKLNLSHFNENLETLLSYTSFLCQYALENGFPYEVYINARKSGKVPYFHIPEGEGKGHYLQSQEMLARIERQTAIVSFNEMLHRVGQQLSKPKTLVIIGETPAEFSETIRHWKRRQGAIFHLKNTGDGATIRPWIEGVKQLAQ
ncbi:DUF58 domain-containing protein [Bacillus sp. Bva_UNVM-123]|uniref:DUF58 domain-containing protein n=1 Tax=Bacillus sp. Bva_UNVM-123 TaxID=2829798 RepID=UPI00391F9D63